MEPDGGGIRLMRVVRRRILPNFNQIEMVWTLLLDCVDPHDAILQTRRGDVIAERADGLLNVSWRDIHMSGDIDGLIGRKEACQRLRHRWHAA